MVFIEKIRASSTNNNNLISNINSKFARLSYDIPERYRNAFYLANAALFDNTSWFLHRAYETAFPILKNKYRSTFRDRDVGDVKIHQKLDNIVSILDQCNSIIDVRFPICRDNGNFELIRGFRANYGENIANTPCLGGLRIHPDITRDQMKALSKLAAMKNFCLGIGMSGAHGGIKINPKEYTENELYAGHLDVAHPDLNTSSKEMKWISETYSECSGQKLNAAAMGKPMNYGGVENWEKAAAFGAYKCLDLFVNDSRIMELVGLKMGLKYKRFIIQGLGKVGKPLAMMMIENGAKCVGVKEHDAYLYDAKGIDLKALYDHQNEKGTIENFGLSKTDNSDSIFTEDCDILILSACHKSLICYVARDVKAKIVLEASDCPITPAAHKILVTKSKLVIPDLYASAGSNVCSFLEYLRNLRQIGISDEDILSASNELYREILRVSLDVEQNENRIQASGTATASSTITGNITQSLFLPLDWNFVRESIESVVTEVGQDIMENMFAYNLGVDAKTAAYARAIHNMFQTIFRLRKLI